jgi:hypothetical protein
VPDENEDEALRAQMQHGYEALRSLAALAIQMCGFLIAADSVLLGYGLSQRHAGFLFVASVFPLVVLVLSAMIIAHGFPMVYVALRAERRLAPDVDTLCNTYLAIRAPSLLRKINELLDAGESDPLPGMRRLVSFRRLIRFRSAGTIILGAAWLSQLALFAITLIFFDYRLL